MKVRAYGGQVINGVFVQVSLTVGPTVSWTYFQKQYHISEWIAKINATTNNVKNAGVVTPTTFPLNSPFLAFVEDGWFWKITVNFYQLVIPTAVAGRDVVLLLSELTHSPIPCMQLFIWRIPFSPFLSIRSTRSSKAKNTPSLFTVLSTLQPYVIIQFAGILVTFLFHKEITLVYYISNYHNWIKWAVSSDFSRLIGKTFIC